MKAVRTLTYLGLTAALLATLPAMAQSAATVVEETVTTTTTAPVPPAVITRETTTTTTVDKPVFNTTNPESGTGGGK